MKIRIPLAAVVILAGAASLARAQSPAVPPAPVLSTAPTPPPGSVPDAGGMSGLPLQVGDLPPGVVAVRVIRRDFSANIPGQAVELVSGGRVLKGTTNADGRAQFEPLPVGETVQARATVGTELLGSQRFQLPSQGGVRLVLVAGVGAGMPPETAPVLSAGELPGAAPAGVAPAATSGAPAVPAAPPVEAARRTQIAIPLIIGFVLVGAGFFWFTRRPASVVSSVPPAASSTDTASRSRLQAERTALFEQLVGLEQEFETGAIAADAHSARREELMKEIVDCDAALDALERHAA